MRIFSPTGSLLIVFDIALHALTSAAFSTHPTTFASIIHRKALRPQVTLNVISLPRREKQDRFERTAPVSSEVDLPCLLTIHNKTYDLSAWANAHPGGVKVLQRFHGKDATKAFDGAGHSRAAYEMLKDFEVVTDSHDQHTFIQNDRRQSLTP